MKKGACFFCRIKAKQKESHFLSSTHFYAVFDQAPVSKGHALIVSRKHRESFFALSGKEAAALFAFLKKVKRVLDKRFHPAGYNIGFNQGKAAGQSLMHAHLHVIPRYAGDVKDPRGGIRNALGNNILSPFPPKGFA